MGNLPNLSLQTFPPSNLAANLAQMAHPAIDFFNADDRVLVVNPLYHVYAMNTTTINLMVSWGS